MGSHSGKDYVSQQGTPAPDDIPARLHVLSLPEVTGMILSQLPTATDLRFAGETCRFFQNIISTDPSIRSRVQADLNPANRLTVHMWNNSTNSGHAHFQYNSILRDVLTRPSWGDSLGNFTTVRYNFAMRPAGGLPGITVETFLCVNCFTGKTQESRDALVAELNAVSPFWKSRQISKPAAKRITVLSTGFSRTYRKNDGHTIGDLVDIISSRLRMITAFPPPGSPNPTTPPTLQVIFMGPLVLVMAFDDWHPYLHGRWQMRHQTSGVISMDQTRAALYY
ncbi:hypothetical protein K490DRAFT_59071 [Saccharata proteae CBS 121410]|uniref:F-box domain-containing protein n=1 Tax=Saccharata proteae CBS 121410 TaxID=1314787 RepID=A0A9P4LV65_9PEZI|nr:hypothetical protein K490DRAFT_59071 [Saccharata proteae CBS 121410]